MRRAFEFTIGLAIILVAVASLYNARNMPPPSRGNRPITLDYYIDVQGNTTSLEAYRGDYLWVNYAAERCDYCGPQSEALRTLDRQYGDKLIFITLITSTEKLAEAPSAGTALDWADRYGLAHDRVLAYYSTRPLPYHILYSPAGDILYEGAGPLSIDQIVDIIRAKTPLLN
ncbi:MAG TPA: hypothetical protein ENI99_03655 [Sedimenticola sp.]|nr:hypothetical protein [Sedimenticola sp.]